MMTKLRFSGQKGPSIVIPNGKKGYFQVHETSSIKVSVTLHYQPALVDRLIHVLRCVHQRFVKLSSMIFDRSLRGPHSSASLCTHSALIQNSK